MKRELQHERQVTNDEIAALSGFGYTWNRWCLLFASGRINKGKIMKTNFLAYCVILILSGCWANKVAEEAAEGTVKEIQDGVKLFIPVLIYYEAKNNEWPDSMEDLKAFCSEAKKECPELDWNKYIDVSFQKLPDGRLKIEFHRSQDQGKFSFSTILDVPTPQ